jgi:hypothetical protein
MPRQIPRQKDSPFSQPEFSDELSGYVARGNAGMVRKYFDDVLWEKKSERPTWAHLKLAVLREDKAIAKLLVTWGARATEGDLAELQRMDPKKYPDYLKVLRQAGHSMTAEKISAGNKIAEKAQDRNDSLNEEIIRSFIDDKFVDHRINQIPQEWRKTLHAFHETGAKEAIIAGGALRDTFNKRAVKDVDIFLKSRGSVKKNRKFLKQVFAAAGLRLVGQPVYTGGYGNDMQDLPDPKQGVFIPRRNLGYGGIIPETKSESWVVIAGSGKTEYNIVFMEGPLAEAMGKAVMENRTPAKQAISAFDLGLCQIGYDGDAIVTTEKYRKDVAQKLIEIDQDNPSTLNHVERIRKKYDDWKIGSALAKVIQKEEERKKAAAKPRPSRYRGYGGDSRAFDFYS